MQADTPEEQSLERRVEKEVTRKGLRAAIADTVTAAVWATGLAVWRSFRDEKLYGVPARIEYRILNIAGETIVGRPYGVVRDYILHKFDVTEESGFWKKALADGTANSIANVVFYAPLYAGTLYLSGADEKQIVTACGISLAVSMVIGRPYGKCLEIARQWFGVKQNGSYVVQQPH